MSGKKDFLKNNILRKLVIMSPEDVAKDIGVSLYVVRYFDETIRTGEPFGKMITEQDVMDLYLEGLTFREIGYLKGISKEGVRHVYGRLPVDKEYIKKEHRKRRGELWYEIRRENVLREVSEGNKKDAARGLGYTERYLTVLLRDIRKKEME